MTPFKDPYCTKDGVIFDLLNIVPYLRKNGKNPMGGEPMTQSDLVKLNFFKNEQGEYHCPVTYKTFTEHSHIVAVRETGNVYSFNAYQELNKEPQYYFDLMTNDKFDPKKLITIHDPKSPGRHRSLYAFAKDSNEESKEETKRPGGSVVEQSGTQRRILDSLKEDGGGLGATKELREKYQNNPAFFMENQDVAS